MSASDPIEDALNANVRRASDDDGSFEAYEISDLIKADQYVKSKALSSPFAALKRGKMIQPGPVQ